MNGKKGSIHEINIFPSSLGNKVTVLRPAAAELDKKWILEVWRFCMEDKNRVLFSLKVGLAVLLVSLLILFRAPYQVLGTSIIWSILTVAIMFEYTVGATFNRGFNRALGSLLAGILAITVAQLALRSGRVAEPIIIGISIFLIGAITSFMKQWPSLVDYEYGFRVILFTYCLIIVSGYRMGNPIRNSMDRLYSIAIGGIIAILVNVLVFPMWAGEQLHQELVNNFNSVADSLQECVKKYLEEDNGSNHPEEFSTTVVDEFPDEPAYKKCKSTLNSSAKLENLANAAKWEPPHGRFRHFFYPWLEYIKVNAVLRYCAYEVMALHGVLHSEIQAPYNLRITFQKEIQDATSEAAELVRCLGKNICNMQRSMEVTPLLNKVHTLTERLQHAIDLHSYLLTPPPPPPPAAADNVNSTAITKQIFSGLSQNLLVSSSTSDDQMHMSTTELLDDNNKKFPDGLYSMGLVPPPSELSHQKLRKQSRRQYSWPSREVDTFEGGAGAACVEDFAPKMKALETTAALSLSTFTSLLIEFVARLDHLVEAVDHLARIAKFKP